MTDVKNFLRHHGRNCHKLVVDIPDPYIRLVANVRGGSIMIRKNMIDVPRLFALRSKGYSVKTIAQVLGLSVATVRTIVSAFDKVSASTDQKEGPKFRKAA